MHLTSSAYTLWTLTVVLEGLLCAIVVHRRLWRRLPLFTAYVLFKFLVTTALWLVYKHLGYDSAFAYYFFWSTQSLLLVTRAIVCAELCCLVFKSRPGLWLHARRALISVTAAILVYAAVDAYRQVSVVRSFILTSERSLELSVAILLTSFLVIANRYRILVERAPSLIAVGLCIYSAFQILNNTLLKHWLDPYFSWWNNVQVISFQVALVIWLFALRRPLPETKPAPTLLPKGTYHLCAQLIGQRLQDLDRDIQEVMKP
jgi:hypothetical protein